jgi:hypothetical protein
VDVERKSDADRISGRSFGHHRAVTIPQQRESFHQHHLRKTKALQALERIVASNEHSILDLRWSSPLELRLYSSTTTLPTLRSK